MVRYLIIRYKEDLLALHQAELSLANTWMSSHMFMNNGCKLQVERETVVCNLVQTMQHIPTPILGMCNTEIYIEMTADLFSSYQQRAFD